MRYTFSKKERLTHKKSIQELFTEGTAVFMYPFLVKYKTNTLPNNQVLISASKRNFKRAVDRNLLKRRVREAYRLHKHLLYSNQDFLDIALLYNSKEILDFDFIEKKLILVLNRLNKETKIDTSS